MPALPRGGDLVFVCSVDYGYLSLFREVGYRLLFVMARRIVDYLKDLWCQSYINLEKGGNNGNTIL